MDAAIGITQTVDKTGMSLSAISGVHSQQPTHAFDCFASLDVEVAPLFLTNLVDRLIHRSEIVNLEGDSYRLREAKERAELRAKRRKAKASKRKPTKQDPE